MVPALEMSLWLPSYSKTPQTEPPVAAMEPDAALTTGPPPPPLKP